ncbi:peroxisomal membrane protein PMP34 isoform X1 [Gopherus flavomarginatus]|uniref:peroxisomal membrane protein PMP34 isoform X1 n=3 Tax=Gopherus flavomarginatus TaxID=286002 RepID=UPI0021CC0537|nr:peroxisomal membrane protein PMP34 isoform X1 [Gopherus flavomarginatus]
MQGLIARMKQHCAKCSFSGGSCVEDGERNRSEYAGSSGEPILNVQDSEDYPPSRSPSFSVVSELSANDSVSVTSCMQYITGSKKKGKNLHHPETTIDKFVIRTSRLQKEGSVTAMTVFFPLDTARLRLQVDEKRKSKTTHTVLLEIIKEEGLLAPYRGWFPVISSLCCSNFVYFYTFNSLRALWVKGQRSTTGKDLILGFVAGVVNVLLTTPLWVVNTRLKLQGAKFRNEDIVPTNYKGIVDAFHQIIRDEGVLALWNGTFPSLLLVFNPAIQFMFYEGFKRKLLKTRLQLTSLDAFIIGAVAKAVATTVTYPMQTVQSILRFGRHRLNPENRPLGSLKNVLYLLRQRIRRFGLVGLYKGLEAKLLQTVLTAALMFLVYEKLTAATFTVMGLKHSQKH